MTFQPMIKAAPIQFHLNAMLVAAAVNVIDSKKFGGGFATAGAFAPISLDNLRSYLITILRSIVVFAQALRLKGPLASLDCTIKEFLHAFRTYFRLIPSPLPALIMGITKRAGLHVSRFTADTAQFPGFRFITPIGLHRVAVPLHAFVMFVTQARRPIVNRFIAQFACCHIYGGLSDRGMQWA